MTRPNVVLICCDDIGFNEIGAYQGQGMPDRDRYGGERVHTPHINSIARDGAVLTRYYATSAICTPSRYSILTGRYASRSPGVLRSFPPPSPATITWNTNIERNETNIGKVFSAMGYRTGYVGKWHNGAPPLDLDREYADAGDPYDTAYHGKLRAAYERRVDYLREGFGFDCVERVYFGNRESFPRPVQVHNLEWLAEAAEEFIETSGERPFFLYLALSTPHGDHFSDFVAQDPLLTPAGRLAEHPRTSMPPRAELPQRLKDAGVSQRTAMSTWQDDCVGAVLAKLAEGGLSDSTIVVFTCDHLARGKYTCYEGSRVPFVVRWPGQIPAGTEVHALCANVDLVATLAALAGGVLPAGYLTDGASFAPLLTAPGQKRKWRDRLLLEVSNIRGIVTDRWKYVACRASQDVLDAIETDRREAALDGRPRWVGWDGRRNPHAGYQKEGVRYFNAGRFPHYHDADQLYDLCVDLFEQNNLVEHPRHAAMVQRLKGMLSEELRRLPHSFGEFAP